MRCLVPLVFAGVALAADTDFNGRWDITPAQSDRSRAWWLEVRGAGTPTPQGRFVGAPGGQMDEIENLLVKDGEIRFSFTRRYRTPGDDASANRTGSYRARLVGDKLEGTFELEGQKEAVGWTGVRAPVLPDKDDGSWKAGTTVELFNGRDMSGWSAIGGGLTQGWRVENGVLTNSAGAKNLISDKPFWNFALRCEYRLGPGSNSGIGLRNRYEVQLFEDHGKPASKSGNGAIYSRIVPSANASKPAGEWQTLDVRLVGREVTVVLNGKKVIDRREIEGLTAVATDANEAEPGPITLQGDHGSVEVRKMSVTPLTK